MAASMTMVKIENQLPIGYFLKVWCSHYYRHYYTSDIVQHLERLSE
jgi:hypothetical protein